MFKLRKQLHLYQGLLVSTAIIFISCGAVFYGIIPGFRTAQEIYRDNARLSKEVDAIKNRVEILQSFDENDLEQKMRLLIEAVPVEKDVPDFMLSLESLIQQFQITETDFAINPPGSIATESAKAPSPEEKNLHENIVSADLTINGSQENVINFMNTMVSVKRLLRSSEAQFDFDGEADVVTAKLKIDTFFAPLPEVIGKPTDPLERLTDAELAVFSKLEAYQVPQKIPVDDAIINSTGFKQNPFAPIELPPEFSEPATTTSPAP